jgi:N-acetylmuramoyl-L-alanine amidase
MAHVNPQTKLVEADPGDTLRVVNFLRPKNYGTFLTPTKLPEVGINHLTAAYLPFGANNAAHDGTLGIARRMRDMVDHWYYHGILSRDGVYAQILPVDRCALATEGYSEVVPNLPLTENNRLGYQVAWANLGFCSLDGQQPFKDQDGNVIPVDPHRSDLVRVGTKLWQQPTAMQARAAGELWHAIQQYTGMRTVDTIRGHHDLGSGAHADPGPTVNAALRVLSWPLIIVRQAPGAAALGAGLALLLAVPGVYLILRGRRTV